jgi:hypothetical protein
VFVAYFVMIFQKNTRDNILEFTELLYVVGQLPVSTLFFKTVNGYDNSRYKMILISISNYCP